MSNPEWLLAQEHPGATNCFLLGHVPPPVLAAFQKYKEVVWFASKDTLAQIRPLPTNVHAAQIDTITQEQLEEIVTLLIQGDPRVLPCIFCSHAIIEKDSGAYEYILSRIHMHSDETLRARQTRQEEGFTAQQNILHNFQHYAQNRFSGRNKNLMAGSPVAIVGAGPSLDSSVPVLKGLAGKVFIFAVDSALPVLHREGLRPDATFSVDAEKDASACVPEGMPLGTIFLSCKSPPDWLDQNAVQSLFLSGNNLTEDWLEKFGTRKTDLRVLGNCGITAVNVAAYMGFSPILLFGLDHATDESGAGHAKDVTQNVSRGKTHNPANRTTTVPGNYKERVKTFLFNEWEKLDQLLSSLPESQEVWNITDRGAKYDKARLLHPGEFHSAPQLPGHKPQLTFIAESIPPGTSQAIRDTVHRLLEGELDTFKTLLATETPEESQCLPMLSRIYCHQEISLLLGTLSFKVIPHLLNWGTAPDELKRQILMETKAMCRLLCETVPTSRGI